MDELRRIRDGNEADQDEVADILADAFACDPVFNWVMPSTALYPTYFRLMLRDVYLPDGMVHLTAEGNAAALWLPPTNQVFGLSRLGILELGMRLVVKDGMSALRRAYQQEVLYARYSPDEPHYYLQCIGCRTADQGKGFGSGLLSRGTALCDRQGMPAYLECSHPRNIQLYERHGFHVVGQDELPDGGPPIVFMWRNPH